MSSFKMDTVSLNSTNANFDSIIAEIDSTVASLNNVHSKLLRYRGLGIEGVCRKVSNASQNLKGCSQNIRSEQETLNQVVAEVREADGNAKRVFVFQNIHNAINKLPDYVTNNAITVMNASELSEMISCYAAAEGTTKENVFTQIKEGLIEPNKVISKINSVLGKINKYSRKISQAGSLAFTYKNGYVILSSFSRSGFFNGLVKRLNGGTGIGTRYRPSNLNSKIWDTPLVRELYVIDVATTALDTAAGVISGANTVLSAAEKISDVMNNDSLSKEEKFCDSTAIGITSVVSAALDAGAPIAGKAVTAAIPIPILNVAAGWATTEVMGIMADVITNETVVNQVSSSIHEVGHAVTSNVKAVSDAGRKVLESESVGDAVANTAKLVGTAIVASADVAVTTVTETAKVVGTVVVETAKEVGKRVGNAVSGAVNKVKNFFKW